MMEKFFSNKYAWMSAALLAGAVGFTSCSSDDDGGSVPFGQGEKSEAQMAVAFKSLSKSNKGTAADANLDGTTPKLLQTIENLVIQPGDGTTYGAYVNLGSLTVDASGKVTPSGLTEKTGAQNAVEYYSNQTISLPDETKSMKFFGGDVMEGTTLKSTVGLGEEVTGISSQDSEKKYYKMPKLYYYGLDNQLQYATTDYASTSTWTDVGTSGLQKNDNVKSVRMDGINYAVGMLQSTVKLGANCQILAVTDETQATDLKDENGVISVDESKVATIENEEAIEIVGFIINDQQATVSPAAGFVAGSTVGTATVYDAQGDGTGGVKITTTGTATNYTRLFETPASQESMLVTLRCKNVSGHKIATRKAWNDDDQSYELGFIAKDAEFFLTVNLVKGDASGTANSIIDQDYTTKANFTINSLYNAYSVMDPEYTDIDATVGVLVDLAWQEGYTFDATIE